MTHELSDDVDDYLAQALWPLKPMLLFGRSAKASPVCKPSEALWYAWKDSGASLSLVDFVFVNVTPSCTLYGLQRALPIGALQGHIRDRVVQYSDWQHSYENVRVQCLG